MNAPKIHQSTAMRTTRRFWFRVAFCGGLFSFLALFLHSKSTQCFIYNRYATPALETLGVSTDFSGMDYSEGEFTIEELDLRLYQKTTATLKGVHIADVRWRQGIVQIASISCDTISIDARDTALFSQWLRDLPADTTNEGFLLR